MSENSAKGRWYLRFPGVLLPALAIALVLYSAFYPSQAWSVLAALCRITWWLFKAGLAVSLVCSLFLLLHPLVFALRLRGTPAGQRGHLEFQYFFGLMRLEASGGIHTQEVRLGFWRWSWRLAGNGRKRPSAKPPSSPPSPAASQPEPVSPPDSGPAAATRSETPPPLRESAPEPVPPSPPAETRAEPAHPVPPPAPPATPAASLPASSEPVSPPPTEPIPALEPGPVSPPSTYGPEPGSTPSESEPPETIEPLPSLPREAARQSSTAKREIPLLERIRADFKKLRRKASDGWKMFRKYANLARKAWRRASPMVRRLASDLWQSLNLMPSLLRVRYGLAEAHLTGMTQGLAAPVAGLLLPFSIRFEPVPVFTGTTIHVRAEGGIRIRPWRVLAAFLVLLATREFWQAVLDLWRWRKSAAGSPPTAV